MESLSWVISAVTSQVAESAIATGFNSILFALAGLVLGIVFVVIAGRKKAFKRTNRVWSLVAAMNYVYIPVVLMIFGGAIGGIRGAHQTAGKFIDKTSQPLVEYGHQYTQQFGAYLSQLPLANQPGMTLKEAVAQQLVTQGGLEAGSLTHSMVSMISLATINYLLDEIDVPEAVRTPVFVAKALLENPVDQSAFLALPRSLNQAVDAFFRPQYIITLSAFLPFLLLPFVEFGLYLLFGRIRKQPIPQQTQEEEDFMV